MKTYSRAKTFALSLIFVAMLIGLIGRIFYLMVIDCEHYIAMADDLHQRERSIKAARGRILDRNGVVLADNKTVCTVSVIHSQVKDPERVISVLCEELGKDEAKVRKSVEKVSSMERIASNVDKETGDRIRAYKLDGVKVDEDYKRYYVYGDLASKVLGFTGADNQGILGLEVKYEEYLKGVNGQILTMADANGVELDSESEQRKEPVSGNDLWISIDYNIQEYATQLANQTLKTKEAKSVSIIVMDPNNGEIFAMVNAPEYDLNNPFEIECDSSISEKEKQDMLNQMWRNTCINDTYEPGSIFKTVTASIGLETKILSLDLTYHCPGYKIVEDRRIRCARTTGHGSQTFTQTVMNSCNPAFIEWGLRIGTDRFYDNMQAFGMFEKTGIDISGEAGTIMHKKENIGTVELATISFGQSFQITPIKMMQTVAMIVNGGNLVTPHFGVKVTKDSYEERLNYKTVAGVISDDTSRTMQGILEEVVAHGGGSRAYIEGYSIGGKTATSEKLPRGNGKYIAAFIGFAPADNPQVIAMCIIDEPVGVYYGGTIAAPVVKELFENILPYLGIEPSAEESQNGQ